MIGRLRGTLLEKQPPRLLIDVQGVGYELEAPMSTFYELPAQGESITIRTHLAIKDDGHILYGFHTEQERALFRSLIRVSGVGPKMALAFLSGMRTEEFLRCVQRRDTAALIRLPGVGKKTAERLVIEMQDRVSAFETQTGTTAGAFPCTTNGASESLTEAMSALLALGYKTPEAQQLLAGLAEAELSSEELIRLALRKAVHKS